MCAAKNKVCPTISRRCVCVRGDDENNFDFPGDLREGEAGFGLFLEEPRVSFLFVVYSRYFQLVRGRNFGGLATEAGDLEENMELPKIRGFVSARRCSYHI